MPEPTLDELSALFDEKLRPVNAKLDEHSRRLAELTPKPRAALPKALLATAGTLVILAGVFLAGRAVLATQSANPASTAPGRVLFADDFSNPAAGLFPIHGQDVASLPGDHATAQWEYNYQDGALIGDVGAPSLPLNGRLIGGSARSPQRVMGDFAVEVTGQAVRNAAAAVYGLRFFGGREFGFGLLPGKSTYELWEIFRPPLVQGQSAAIAAPDQPNFLRMEVRGNAVRLLANGQAMDSVQDDGFGTRPVSVGVFFDTSASPGEDTVEIRFTDFKVYSLS